MFAMFKVTSLYIINTWPLTAKDSYSIDMITGSSDGMKNFLPQAVLA